MCVCVCVCVYIMNFLDCVSTYIFGVGYEETNIC